MVGQKSSQSPTGDFEKTTATADLFKQVENLQHELLVLAQRAEHELESMLRVAPEPIVSMLISFAQRVSATSVSLSIQGQGEKFSAITDIKELHLSESDLQQSRIALSGREMAFDFVHQRVFFPIVVFENPIAVAVVEVPGLNSRNYESVCAAASAGLGELRKQLKVSKSNEARFKSAS